MVSVKNVGEASSSVAHSPGFGASTLVLHV